MAKHISLPTHRMLSLDIDALLARHRGTFGAARMDADDDAAAQAAADAKAAADAAAAKAAADKAAAGDNGFPPNTPIEQMTADQREAYWKHQSRKHEERSKAFGNLNPETLRALQEKANKHDELERELMSDKDREIAQVREQERLAATPRVVRAEFKAAAKGVLNAEQLTALLEDRDLTKYVDANGDPDEDKIAKLVTAFAPAQESQDQRRRGPSPVGAGARGSASGPSLSAGADAYARRHGKK